MTISSTVRTAGPFIGNGTASVFPFTFKVFSAADLDVIKLTTSTGVEATLVLNTDYTVSLNGNQNTNPGGSVTLTAGALATGFTLTLTSDIANLQPTDLTNQGGFYPEVITDSFDRSTIQIQQMADDLTRSIKTPISDGLNLNMELPTAAQRANSFLAFDASGEPTVVTAGSSGAPATITRQVFSGTGSQTVFTLASDPGALGNSAQVYIGGVYQQRSTYTIAGTTLTFSAAPVAGTDNIEFVNFLTSNIGATSADLVTYTPAGSGAVARSAASKFGEMVSVKDFGAVGDGVADDTAAIQAAMSYCSNNGKTVFVPSGTYRISTVTITNGLRGVYCEGLLKGFGTAPVATLVLGSTGNPIQNATFTLRMDQSSGDLRAVQGYDTTNCMFTDCQIFGFTNSATLNHYAFWMDGPCVGNVFTGNHITLFNTPTQRGFGIAFYGTQGTAQPYGGFFAGAVSRAQFPSIGNTISNNIIVNGSYAISIQFSEYNIVSGNYCFNQNHRSIYLANAAWGNTITGNVLREFVSTAVLLGYCSSANVVSDNFCEKTAIGGEAAININTGARNNLIDGNTIISPTNYGIYMACDMVGNTVSNNNISNQYLAAIALENDWTSPRPTNAIFSRPNYEAPPSPYTAWSTTNSTENTIKANTIGAGYSGRNTAAIALAQIDAGGLTSLTNNNVSQNHVTSATDIAYNLHFYADTPAKFTGAVLTENNFNPSNSELSATTTGSTTWSDRLAYYADNRQFDTLITGEVLNFSNGDTTPSVLSNSSVPSERIYTFVNYTSPTNITYFDDGYNGQTITLRLSTNVSIIYNTSLIRPKGLVDVTGVTSNDFIQFIRLGSVWLETWRSF
jgi:parallel beta-helix repeat protein